MKRSIAWLLPVLLVATASTGALAATSPEVLPSLNPMLERASKGVVNVSVRGSVETQNPLLQDPFFRRFFNIPDTPQQRQTQSVGSGVIVDAEEGYVVTNHHVIENADSVTITLTDRRELDAEIIGSDRETDIAVLKVDPQELHEVPFANSDELKIGDFVVAIGNPFGIGQTATLGIVSAVGRSGLGIEGYEDFIQTDASINPGNSGGALVNQAGELVGINTAILSRGGGNIGIGFAIPSNMVRYVVDQLIEHGEVQRGRIGVLIQDVTSDLAAALDLESLNGALVSQVLPNSPAQQAGLEAGDVIVALNGETVESSSELRNEVGLMQPGTGVELGVIRDGERRTVKLALGGAEATAAAETAQGSADGGGRLAGVSLGQIPEQHPLFGQVQGVLVQDLQPGSEAARAGLRPGDVITTANRKAVSSAEELRQIAEETDEKPLLLQVRRGQAALFVAVG